MIFILNHKEPMMVIKKSKIQFCQEHVVETASIANNFNQANLKDKLINRENF